jgi:murein DD-endopeptidase MepM/ murein hydrolase activator NlpD
MSKAKYIYNNETCQFELVTQTAWSRSRSALRFLLTCLLLSSAIYGIHTRYFSSPKEILLKRENSTLKSYYQQLQKEIESAEKVLAKLQNSDDNLYRMLLDINAVPQSVRKAGAGGTNKYTYLENHDKCILETVKRVDTLKGQLHVQSKSYEELLSLTNNKANMLTSIPAICPIYDKDLIRMTSPFGIRMHPITKVPTMHNGVDYFAPKGTPIYAPGDGVVISAMLGWNSGFGNKIEIDHGHGYITRYCHQSSLNVRKGDIIKRGQCIGFVGNTGYSTGPHLHYEVLKDRRNVDPMNYILTDITPSEYQHIISLSSI